MNKLLLLLLAGIFSFTHAVCINPADGEKYALIIGIGKYEPGNGWDMLHADNDAEVIKHTLVSGGFAENHLLTITNEKATKAGILNGFTQLLEQLKPGDIAVIHYSGHGQQLTDTDGDEPDGLDEALVPYDAPMEPIGKFKDYKGHLHITDDELAVWFAKIRNKVGSNGQLIFFLDACHAGTASRGNSIVRGGASPLLFAGSSAKAQVTNAAELSGYNQPGNAAANKGRFILIAATKSQDPDYEHPVEKMGSLTYAISESLQKKVTTAENTYRDLFEYIRNIMAVIVPGQTPQIEGDMDITIFNGNMVIQQPFYKVLNEEKNGLPAIDAGKIFAIKKGVKIGFYPIGTRTTAGKPAIVSGTVEVAENMKSYVRTNRKITKDSLLLLQAFVLSDVYEKNQAKIFTADNLPEEIKKEISAAFIKSKMQQVNSKAEADLIIEKKGELVHILNAADGSDVTAPFTATGEVPVYLCGGVPGKAVKPAEFISTVVSNYSKSSIVKKIFFSDHNLRLNVKLVPEQGAQNNSGYIFTENAKADLTLYNTGTRSGYVYLVEFDPVGRICELVGFDTEILLDPGQKDVTTIEFVPPFGRYLIKAFMTEKPIGNELRWLITSQKVGEKGVTGTRGDTNELIKILSEIMENPAAARSAPVGSGGVTVTDFSYDLKK